MCQSHFKELKDGPGSAKVLNVLDQVDEKIVKLSFEVTPTSSAPKAVITSVEAEACVHQGRLTTLTWYLYTRDMFQP